MIPTILLVMDEGNPRYTETLRQYRVRLTQRIFDEGWQVATAVGVAQALAQLEAQKISLLVFDTTGYRGDRVAQLKLLRASTDLPVLVVVEGGDEHAELEMLENGADDCLHRPASDPLIIAHVKALLKRVHALPPKELRFDGLRLSLAEHVVELDGKTVALSPREFDLLYYLARNPNLALGIPATRGTSARWTATSNRCAPSSDGSASISSRCAAWATSSSGAPRRSAPRKDSARHNKNPAAVEAAAGFSVCFGVKNLRDQIISLCGTQQRQQQPGKQRRLREPR